MDIIKQIKFVRYLVIVTTRHKSARISLKNVLVRRSDSRLFMSFGETFRI